MGKKFYVKVINSKNKFSGQAIKELNKQNIINITAFIRKTNS